MERLPGQRHGSYIYFHHLEPYHLDSRYKDTAHKYYRCVNRTTDTQCDASIYLSEGGDVTRIGGHNHPIDRNMRDDCVFREEVRRLAQDILLEPDEILRQACRQNPRAGERCSVGAIISFIKRIRKEFLPPVPQTLEELGHVLENYGPTREIYRGVVTPGDGSSALVFAHTDMLEFLSRARWLHIDGTFSVVPSNPQATQLWIVFIREGDKGYAAVFVLCRRRTKVLYDAIWHHILELCPQLRESLRAVWTDFEQAAVASLRQNFPQIYIRGCWFHFCRAVYRKWKSLRMIDPPKEILYLTWGLPLLPAEQIAEGCRVITDLADPLAIGPHQDLNAYTHYLRRQWVPLASVTSVYGTPIRTNNVAEAFNRRCAKKLGGVHPRIWVFLEKLTETINDELIKMNRWRTTGQTGQKPQHKAWVRADENLAESQRLLATGRFDIEAFLRAATTPYQRLDLHYAVRTLRADGEEQHDLPVAQDMLNPPDVFPDDPAQEVQVVRHRRGPRPRLNARRGQAEVGDNDDSDSAAEHHRNPVRPDQRDRGGRVGRRNRRPRFNDGNEAAENRARRGRGQGARGGRRRRRIIVDSTESSDVDNDGRAVPLDPPRSPLAPRSPLPPIEVQDSSDGSGPIGIPLDSPARLYSEADSMEVEVDVVQENNNDNVHVDAVVEIVNENNTGAPENADHDGGPMNAEQNVPAPVDQVVDPDEIVIVGSTDETDSEVQEIDADRGPGAVANINNDVVAVASTAGPRPNAKVSRSRKKNLRRKRRKQERRSAQCGVAGKPRPRGCKRRRTKVAKAPNSPLHLSNRAHALLVLNRPQASLTDADHAVRLRPDWGKGHYRRGVALSALGRHEEAFFALCTSVAIDRNQQGVRHELTRVLHRILSPSLRRQGPTSTRSPYNNLVETSPRSRRNRHNNRQNHLLLPLVSPSQRHRRTILNTSDCEDNSSGEDEFNQSVCRRLLSNASSNENTKLHSILDRVYQEVEKLKRIDPRPAEVLLPPLTGGIAEFDCILCCRPLWKPVTTPCGHTYCWMCLDRCLDYSSACPLCVTSLADYLASSQKTVTDFVERALKTVAPAEYSSRAASHRLELVQGLGLLGSEQIAVFVCTTAFPCVACPLFVYEPRYRLMVRRCVESGVRHFGIAACLNREATGTKRYAEYGTILEIKDRVLMKDGCSILSTIGGRRFRVLSGGESDGYDTAQVEFVRDSPVQIENLRNLTDLHDKVRSKGRRWWSTVSSFQQGEIQRVFGKMPEPEEDWSRLPDGPSWTWWLLAILPLGPQLQVGILGTTSLEKRLRAIDKTLNHMEKRQLTVAAAPSEDTTTSSSICRDGRAITESAVSVVQHS